MLNFWANLRLAVLIEVVLIKKKRVFICSEVLKGKVNFAVVHDKNLFSIKIQEIVASIDFGRF